MRIHHDEILDGLSRSVTVCARLEGQPEAVNIQNCERSLRLAALSVMQLWEDVQKEKSRRARLWHEIEPKKTLLEQMELIAQEISERRKREALA